MRRTILLPAIAVGLGVAVFTNLPASADEKTYPMTGFSKVSASAGVNVILKQGPYAIAASGSAKALERLEIEKDGDTLKVGRKSNFMGWGNSGRITVTVSSPTYTGVSSSSGSSVKGAGLSMSGASALSASSGANLDLTDLKVSDASVSVSSGADADITGACQSISIESSSGASFDGEQFKCETAVADASSGSSINIYASKSASGDASSGASVNFYGNPAQVTEDESSGGSVRSK